MRQTRFFLSLVICYLNYKFIIDISLHTNFLKIYFKVIEKYMYQPNDAALYGRIDVGN